FKAANISTTRRTCGLVSDSSMRFERGVDPAMIEVAMNQATSFILDLDITPNRGDCMSARGLARDLAAYADLPLIEPDDGAAIIDPSLPLPVVSIEATDACPLYSARRIEGIAITSSPEWIQTRLLAAGLRPINGVVDVLNYTMLDLGQPMHAFDAATLQGDIQVRSAIAGESFLALDGREVKLNSGDLVVADDASVIALAGIMGSEPTGVNLQTTSIILESAAFKAANISTTRRTCGLVSDASMRFERGVDPAMIEVAMNQATSFILDLFGGKASAVTQEGDAEGLINNKSIAVDMRRVESRLGIATPAEADFVLQRMGFGLQRDGDILQVSVPSHRHDVSLFEDISEEYARVIGFDQIPAVMPALTTSQPRKVDDSISSAVALGFVQVINYAF
ncbi:MAG: phenylalanine--tRNA ligase beta subunit-related protein, partial [Ghiorsea sp.]